MDVSEHDDLARVQAALSTPEWVGRTLVLELLKTLSSHRSAGRMTESGELTVNATITIQATRSADGTGCFPFKLCWEDEVAMQSRCVDAWVC